MKNHVRIGLKAATALLLCGVLAFAPVGPALAASATYTVNAGKVNIRKSPSTDSKILKTIREGEEVKLVSSAVDGWLQISYDGLIGYVMDDYVTLTDFSGSMVATVVGADKLNIRAEASSKGKVLLTVPRGATVTVDGLKNESWFHVSYQGKQGYASMEYLMLSVITTGATEQPATEEPQPQPTPTPGSATVDGTLRKGDKSDAVQALQNRLIELGYLTGRADGDFGKATEAAVKAFQDMNGLTVDGEAGTRTQNLLYSATAIAASGKTLGGATGDDGVLSYGDDSDAVKALQQSLIELGYLTGRADGEFGKATEAAVKAFQQANGIEADGRAGAATQNAIAAALARPGDGTLQKGDKGNLVEALQKNLIVLGYLGDKADGDYGTKTFNAVKAFQSSNHLTANGIADLATQNAIASAVKALTSTPSSVLLQKGDSGAAVEALQRQLSTLGYLSGAVDGKFGAATRSAVKAFQRDHSIGADGIAGTQTLEAIAQAVKESTTGDDPSDSNALKKGSRGDAVKALQQKLITLGYLSGDADGIFGTGTISAVKAFQTVVGLPADGVAGKKTQNALDTAISKQDQSSDVLQKGDSGEDVKLLQKQLITLGYLTGKADGVFGKSTENAVKAFQSAAGLSSDGVAGKKTQDTLLRKIAENAGSEAGSAQPQVTSLKRGSTGSAVKAVQNRLIALGYLPSGNADGDFGTLTEKAVKAFQGKNGLSADGVVSTKTLERLNSKEAVQADAPVVNTGALASSIIATAKQYLGCPYIYGTRGPKTFDCSGFTYYVFKQYGYSLRGSAYMQGYDTKYTKISSISALQPGDLVYFNTISDSDLSDHAGIYIGDGEFIHASSGGGYVMISSLLKGYYYTNFSWGRRVLE